MLIMAITFITILLTDVTISFSETQLEAQELTEGTTFDSSWENTGSNYRSLQNMMPIEYFSLIILPIIILVGYIVLKTSAGVLPNWLSGG